MNRHGPQQPLSRDQHRILMEGFRDGHWRDDPWFLRNPSGLASSTGQGRYSRAALERAAEALARVYTPEACRKVLSMRGGPPIAILFMLIDRERLFPLIRLGLDLADIGEPSSVLANRLCIGAEYAGVQLEAEIWASLVRAGIKVDHGSDLVGPPQEARPDLRALWDFREYFIEAKRLNPPDADIIGREIMDRVGFAVLRAVPEARGLELRFSETFAALPLSLAGRESLSTRQTDIEHRLVELVVAFHAGRILAGEHDVLGLGSVFLGRTDCEGNCALSGFHENPPETESDRVFRLIRDAASQLPPRGRAVIFIDAPTLVDVRDLQILIQTRVSLTAPTFSNAHFVVVRTQSHPPAATVMTFPGVSLTDGDSKLVHILLAGRGERR